MQEQRSAAELLMDCVLVLQYYDESRTALLEQDAQSKAAVVWTPAAAKTATPMEGSAQKPKTSTPVVVTVNATV